MILCIRFSVSLSGWHHYKKRNCNETEKEKIFWKYLKLSDQNAFDLKVEQMFVLIERNYGNLSKCMT